MPPLRFDLLLSPGHWFDPNPGPPGPLYVIPGVLLGAALVVSLILALFRRRIFRGDGLKNALAKRVATWGLIISINGLFLMAARVLLVPILSMRAWLYLDLLAGIGLLIYFIYYLRARYPQRRAAYEAEELRRKYLPTARRRRR